MHYKIGKVYQVKEEFKFYTRFSKKFFLIKRIKCSFVDAVTCKFCSLCSGERLIGVGDCSNEPFCGYAEQYNEGIVIYEEVRDVDNISE
jgi:hypothetical protein